MKISKLEQPEIRRKVIARLVQGERQENIALDVGLNQAQISRFHSKYRDLIKRKKELHWQKTCDRILSELRERREREKLEREQSLYPLMFRKKLAHKK